MWRAMWYYYLMWLVVKLGTLVRSISLEPGLYTNRSTAMSKLAGESRYGPGTLLLIHWLEDATVITLLYAAMKRSNDRDTIDTMNAKWSFTKYRVAVDWRTYLWNLRAEGWRNSFPHLLQFTGSRTLVWAFIWLEWARLLLKTWITSNDRVVSHSVPPSGHQLSPIVTLTLWQTSHTVLLSSDTAVPLSPDRYDDNFYN